MIETAVTREELLEEEYIIVRNSGEIPEIALHTSLYYLCEEEEGPRISLRDEERQTLYDAALARAREIVLRDLEPDNRDLPLYRGVARTIANWRRLQNLCRRIRRQPDREFAGTVSTALVRFLARELTDVQSGRRRSSLNCTAREIEFFCGELGLDPSELPLGWQTMCKN